MRLTKIGNKFDCVSVVSLRSYSDECSSAKGSPHKCFRFHKKILFSQSVLGFKNLLMKVPRRIGQSNFYIFMSVCLFTNVIYARKIHDATHTITS